MDSVVAKQFLISRVMEQAELEHAPVSEIERKMLYFTEVHSSLPDIYEVNAEFERTCDADEYENKITGLLRRARAYDEKQSGLQGQQWQDAIETLKAEDHYILVMVHAAFPEFRKAIVPTHRVRDYIIYVGIGIVVVVGCIVAAMLSH
jgi:hypothetical protein